MLTTPLSDFLGSGHYRGMVCGLRFPQDLSGLFGGIELELVVMAVRARESRRITVLCDGVFDFALAPEYTLIEGMPSLELTRDDPLLEPARLAGLWCDENQPDVNKHKLSLLRCGMGYVIAEEFSVVRD